MNKVLLIILDGWGVAPTWGGNAIAVAKTPYYDYLWKNYPHSLLSASGVDVGLPGHEMGNSEVGHMNIGAGTIVKQDILRIDEAIKNGSFYKNPTLTKAFDRVKGTSGNIHIIGLLSDGGVHGHINHAMALVEMAHRLGVENLYIHIFTDGRDTPPMSAQLYIARLQDEIKKLKTGHIATVCGRYYAMDRDKRWSRLEKAYNLMTQGVGIKVSSPLSSASEAYKRGESDEFISPTIIAQDGKVPPNIKDNDSVIFWNFRSDRARELTQAFLKPQIEGMNRTVILKNLYFVSMIPYGYEKELGVRPFVAFPPKVIGETLTSTLSKNNIKQMHIAETEKYAHITYFLNGLVEQPYAGEDRVVVPSKQVATYDLFPQMSAPEITKGIVDAESKGQYGFIVANFANADMVGHTGSFNAKVVAVETIDGCLKTVIETAQKNGYNTIVTADHGNAEQALDPKDNTGATEHTNNPVPLIFVPADNKPTAYNVKGGRLADIAPTVLWLMNIQKPKVMTGTPLVTNVK